MLAYMGNRDYAANEMLDRYSDADIDDNDDVPELSAGDRRAAEAAMARRDRQERAGKRGSRAARRSRAPAFLGSEDDMEDDDGDVDDELGLSQFKARTRRQYDERRDQDDMDGIEDVCVRFGLLLEITDPILCRSCHWNS
jgi:DNA replication licensing factor MCM2